MIRSGWVTCCEGEQCRAALVAIRLVQSSYAASRNPEDATDNRHADKAQLRLSIKLNVTLSCVQIWGGIDVLGGATMTDVHERVEKRGFRRPLDGQNRPHQVPIGASSDRWSRLSAGAVSSLTQTIEGEIIPFLLMAHQHPSASLPIATVGSSDLAPDDIAELAEMTLVEDVDGLTIRVEAFRTSGLSLGDIFARLLAPTANYLYHIWSNDLCGFAEVTLALWRLQHLLMKYSIEFRTEGGRQQSGRRALLLPAPGERHHLSFVMFGLTMMSAFLRRDGWETWIESDVGSPEFLEVIRSKRFDVVEFLVSGDKSIDALASNIRFIRRESENRSIGVVVCGQVFIEHPELVVQVGADLAAPNTREAVLQTTRNLWNTRVELPGSRSNKSITTFQL
jgi:MerR family transcriptional regulator, light-induced transcriptional regulator